MLDCIRIVNTLHVDRLFITDMGDRECVAPGPPEPFAVWVARYGHDLFHVIDGQWAGIESFSELSSFSDPSIIGVGKASVQLVNQVTLISEPSGNLIAQEVIGGVTRFGPGVIGRRVFPRFIPAIVSVEPTIPPIQGVGRASMVWSQSFLHN